MTPLDVALLACLTLGLLLVLRAVAIVATSSEGRFFCDALLGTTAGFGQMLLGVALLA